MALSEQDQLQVDATWARYKSTGLREDRDELILRYMPVVEYVARKLAGSLGKAVDQGDLIGYGVFGLIDAIDKFDTGRNIKFETYATTRIRGSIFDSLRGLDWVPRSVRTKGRAVEKAQTKLEGQLQRTPTSGELAGELGVTEDELHTRLGAVVVAAQVALDDPLSSAAGQGDGLLGDTVPDRRAGPEAALDLEAIKENLAHKINNLSERHKIVLSLYYVEVLTLREIGEVFAVTESRIAQLHTQAVTQIAMR
jgi:RNA polymerase sigma factor FliA